MTLADPTHAHPPLAAGLFGGTRSAAPLPAEPLVAAAKPADEAAARRQNFSVLFGADGGHIHRA